MMCCCKRASPLAESIREEEGPHRSTRLSDEHAHGPSYYYSFLPVPLIDNLCCQPPCKVSACVDPLTCTRGLRIRPHVKKGTQNLPYEAQPGSMSGLCSQGCWRAYVLKAVCLYPRWPQCGIDSFQQLEVEEACPQGGPDSCNRTSEYQMHSISDCSSDQAANTFFIYSKDQTQYCSPYNTGTKPHNIPTSLTLNLP